MKYFSIGLGAIMIRFYLMMGVVIIGGFSGQWWLATLALPIFLSIMLGVTFTPGNKKVAKSKKTAKAGQMSLAAN